MGNGEAELGEERNARKSKSGRIRDETRALFRNGFDKNDELLEDADAFLR